MGKRMTQTINRKGFPTDYLIINKNELIQMWLIFYKKLKTSNEKISVFWAVKNGKFL